MENSTPGDYANNAVCKNGEVIQEAEDEMMAPFTGHADLAGKDADMVGQIGTVLKMFCQGKVEVQARIDRICVSRPASNLR